MAESGSRPTAPDLEPKDIHPYTRQVLAEAGLDMAGQYSKSVNEYLGKIDFGYVITVCANAEKRCPFFPGRTVRLHWPFEDPAKFVGTEEEKLNKFREIRDLIEAKIKTWVTEANPAAGARPRFRFEAELTRQKEIPCTSRYWAKAAPIVRKWRRLPGRSRRGGSERHLRKSEGCRRNQKVSDPVYARTSYQRRIGLCRAHPQPDRRLPTGSAWPWPTKRGRDWSHQRRVHEAGCYHQDR